MNPATVKQILGEKSMLAMYRDCLKVVPLMNQNQSAQDNIKAHFRMTFEEQRHKSDEERTVFREGIVRLLSNFTIYEIKKQYMENPEQFQREVNVHDPRHQQAEEDDEQAASPLQDAQDPRNIF